MADYGPTPEQIRALIAQTAKRGGHSLAELSRVIRRNERYMQRYVHDRSPYALAAEDRARLARFLGMREERLGAQPRPDHMLGLRHRRNKR